MTKIKSHAARELELLEKTVPDALILEFKPEILALCDAFGKSGQSGGSAPYVASAISQAVNQLMTFRPIGPLTGNADEWNDVADIEDGEVMYQNVRDSRVFKDGIDGKPYFIDAIVLEAKDDNRFTGAFWLSKEDYLTGNRELMLTCTASIKSFPFSPKTFYIEVDELEVGKDDFETIIKDPKQLEEVWNYYDKSE